LQRPFFDVAVNVPGEALPEHLGPPLQVASEISFPDQHFVAR
jgi:hypothetical protein